LSVHSPRHIATLCALLAAAQPACLHAAPGLREGAFGLRTPLSADHALEYLMGIVLVMIALGVFAWLMRRLQTRIGSAGASLRIAAALPLGGKERLLLVEVEGERLLLGVGPGGVQLVRRLRGNGAGTGSASAAATPPQDTWLARTLRGAAAR
jgi:flagellar protein FliO/FliZ